MENLNEITLSFATLMSPSFIAYLLYRKITNKEADINISLPVTISLIALNFIILGVVNIELFFVSYFSKLLNNIFPIDFNSKTLNVILILILLLPYFIFGCFFRYFKKEKKFLKYILIASVLSYMSCTLLISQHIEFYYSLLTHNKIFVELEYFDKKIYINPIAIIYHSICGFFIIYTVERKIIPFFSKIFSRENDEKILPFSVLKLSTQGDVIMYPSKFLQENPIISKSLEEISLTKFPELKISFSTNLENTCCYEYELTFDSKDITHIFLNKEFSLFQFITKIDKNDRINYYTIKNLIKAVFYNNKKLKALIEYYLSGADRYNDIEPVVEDENIEIYISDDDNFIINLKLCNKDILRYIR